jgi:hypothetical protein
MSANSDNLPASRAARCTAPTPWFGFGIAIALVGALCAAAWLVLFR